MKPLHACLLIAGAALAGGLAVKMTQPQPIPAFVPAPVPAPATVARMASPTSRATELLPPKLPPKPAPKPWAVLVMTAPALPEVYVESLKPDTRKNEPILTAKAVHPVENASPLFVPPVQYEAPAPPPAPQPQPAPQVQPAPHVQPAPPAQPRRVTLPAGMIVPVRFNQSSSGDKNFDAELAEPLVIDGLVIAERGARAGGRVVDAQNQLELTTISTSDGQKIAISTDPSAKRGDVVRFRLATRVTITERQL